MGESYGSKVCFVTIGATAAFDSLVKAALDPNFLRALDEHNYTKLRLQYGKDGAFLLQSRLEQMNVDKIPRTKLTISGFDFLPEGLHKEMVAAREGVVISHAGGSGTILDALRLSVPLVVVPNPMLMANHQLELAEEMAAQGYAIHGNIENLPKALQDTEIIRQEMQKWPLTTAKGSGKGLVGVLDDELGFVD